MAIGQPRQEELAAFLQDWYSDEACGDAEFGPAGVDQDEQEKQDEQQIDDGLNDGAGETLQHVGEQD